MRGLVFLLLLASIAHAGEPAATEVQRARAHFEAGSGLYQLGRYDEAIAEFSAGYALSHRPQFALNIGQCYRKLGRYADAVAMFRRFLDEAPADAPERASATALLAETEALVPPRPPPPVPVAVTPTPPPPPHRSHRATWIALGVTAGVLVVAGAITLGVLLPSPTEPSTSLGTVRFGP